MKLEYIIKDNKYKNINQILTKKYNISSRLLSKLIKNKQILLNGKSADTRISINIGDIITVLFDIEEDNTNIIPTKMDLKIVFEDDGILVVNKPSKTPVHPSILHYEDSLSNGIRYYYDKINFRKKN